MTTATKPADIQRGYGSDERPVTKVLWERDPGMRAAPMAEMGNYEPSRQTVDYARYYDPAYARAEIDKLWLKTWLYACREEDMPHVGDRIPFQVGPRSFLIIRSGENEFKAFFNSCIHRGTQLCHKAEGGDKIVCPFHAWEWKIDGSIKYIPSHWDFRSITPGNGGLREVQLGQWGGFIFINADPNAVPLVDALSVLPAHFANFAPEKRYTAAHYRKLIPANWKLVQEAFLESYHVVGTHPEALPFNGDSQSQYEIWKSDHGNVGRLVTPSAVPSMLAPADASPFVAAMATASILADWHYGGAALPELDPVGDLRAQLADWHRKVYLEKYGRPIAEPDAIMIDSALYHVFPNMTLWLSEFIPFAYQFLPHESDPELAYFDVRMLMPVAEGQTAPAPSPRIDIGVGGSVMELAPAFGFLALVFDQDMENMPLFQSGVKSADPARNYSTLGNYQEMIVRHWHDLHDRYMAASG